ncbi:hypothetical protein PsSCT_01300 [Pseudomonas sp. SCT]
MLVVEKQHRKDLVLKTCELGAQVVLDDVRRSKWRAAFSFQINDLTRRFKDLIGRSWQIASLFITNEEGSVKRNENCAMAACSGCSGEIARNRPGTAQRKPSQGHRRP